MVISPLTPLKVSTSCSLKPFITDITVIKIEIPKINASDDKIVDTENALSFLKLNMYEKDSLWSVLFKFKILNFLFT